MTITLTSEQQSWLESQVAEGHYGSIEDAIHVAIADLKAVSSENLAWAKPYIDKARQSVAEGHVISGDVFLSRMDDHGRPVATLVA